MLQRPKWPIKRWRQRRPCSRKWAYRFTCAAKFLARSRSKSLDKQQNQTTTKMQWYNEPPSWTEEGGKLTVTTGPKTDFWRKTHYGFVRDNWHFYYLPAPAEFSLEV